jgi:hypothetical protein
MLGWSSYTRPRPRAVPCPSRNPSQSPHRVVWQQTCQKTAAARPRKAAQPSREGQSCGSIMRWPRGALSPCRGAGRTRTEIPSRKAQPGYRRWKNAPRSWVCGWRVEKPETKHGAAAAGTSCRPPRESNQLPLLFRALDSSTDTNAVRYCLPAPNSPLCWGHSADPTLGSGRVPRG